MSRSSIYVRVKVSIARARAHAANTFFAIAKPLERFSIYFMDFSPTRLEISSHEYQRRLFFFSFFFFLRR